MTNDVIDFRFRPIGAQSWTPEQTRRFLARLGVETCPSFEAQSLDLMFEEMDAAGIVHGVVGVPGPTDIRDLDPSSSDVIAEIVAAHPDRFTGFGSIEPSDVEAGVERLEALAVAGMRGVTIDPSTAKIHRQFHDRSLYPLYERAAQLDLIVTTTMSCLLGPYMDDTRPEYVDHVATDFPDLTLIIQHGGWPYVRETIGVAFKQPNVCVVPGQYVHYDFPGSADYVHAMARIIPDQMLFGSVYPNCGPLTDLRNIVRSWDLPAIAERKYLHGNAARLLER